MNIDVHGSIHYAIGEYMRRHGGEKPAKIVLSHDALILAVKGNAFVVKAKTYAGIPVELSPEEGVHIHLCEPEIHLFPEQNLNTIRIKPEM